MLGIGGENFKILWPVIHPVAIPVVHNLARQEVAAKNRLHHKPVLKNGLVPRRIRMVRRVDVDIATLYPPPSFPVWVLVAASRPCALGF